MTEPTKALDSCPFCGNTNAIVYDDLLTFHVGCLSCGATGSASSYRNDAIAAWNRRTPQPTQAQAGAVPLTESEMGEGWRRFQETLEDHMAADPAGVRNMGRDHWLSWAHWKAACNFALGIKGGQHG